MIISIDAKIEMLKKMEASDRVGDCGNLGVAVRVTRSQMVKSIASGLAGPDDIGEVRE